jgi:hypothetical protein
VDDLFARLEVDGIVLRIDSNVRPDMIGFDWRSVRLAGDSPLVPSISTAPPQRSNGDRRCLSSRTTGLFCSRSAESAFSASLVAHVEALQQ